MDETLMDETELRQPQTGPNQSWQEGNVPRRNPKIFWALIATTQGEFFDLLMR